MTLHVAAAEVGAIEISGQLGDFVLAASGLGYNWATPHSIITFYQLTGPTKSPDSKRAEICIYYTEYSSSVPSTRTAHFSSLAPRDAIRLRSFTSWVPEAGPL